MVTTSSLVVRARARAGLNGCTAVPVDLRFLELGPRKLTRCVQEDDVSSQASGPAITIGVHPITTSSLIARMASPRWLSQLNGGVRMIGVDSGSRPPQTDTLPADCKTQRSPSPCRSFSYHVPV
ncbi:hypothetical protein HGRIS_005946 [Hohenbuehelia grisea]|uniref:Uncharacterized protein n=1 Tax=Hohenbuehelia grisea TaxID=104357 RepID=A0ABR3K0V6_9AGAR